MLGVGVFFLGLMFECVMVRLNAGRCSFLGSFLLRNVIIKKKGIVNIKSQDSNSSKHKDFARNLSGLRLTLSCAAVAVFQV
jgi:hypothetical protein